MTAESAYRQSLLQRRSLLFSPNPRLGWVFRDRWTAYTPFAVPQPEPQDLPLYLREQVTASERLVRQRLTRILPLSIIAFAGFLLLSARTTQHFPMTKISISSISAILSMICLGGGATLTAVALTTRRQAAKAHALAHRQVGQAFDEATRAWQERRNHHEAKERGAANARPEWGAVPRPLSTRRLDVFGGTLWSWEALLSTYGTSALATGAVLVIDLSREIVCGELALLSRAAGIEVSTELLPAQLATSTLLSGLGPRELVDAIVESMHGGTPEDARAERSMDDRILMKICDALGDTVSLARIGAALRMLMGEPDDSPALDREERRRVGNELFSVEYRRQAHANLSRIESYIHPIERLGTGPADRGSADLTCIALDSQSRNVRSELLTDLIVQWVTHRIAFSSRPRPSVIVAGADELARRHLERLSDLCERRGVPLTMLFRRLRETSGEMLGGGTVAFMRLGNHEDATKAADFIGRDHSFVLSQITKNVGGNESHTDTATDAAGHTDTISLSRSIGTSTNRGTSSPSGLLHTGASTSTGGSRTRGSGTSETDTIGGSRSVTRNWSSAYAYAQGANWSDADTSQRVYEYAVEPVTLQRLPDHALLLVETHLEGGRVLTPVECDPAIVTLDRVATTPLPSEPPRWAAPPPVTPPRAQLPNTPGPPPQHPGGPRPSSHRDTDDRRPEPPPGCGER